MFQGKFSWRFIAAAGAFIIYAFFVFSNLTTYPGLWLDEGFKMQLARNFAETGVMGMQFEPGEVEYSIHSASTGWPIAAILGVFFKIFGVSLAVARVYASVFLLGTVFLLFYLGRKLWDEKISLFVLFLLITFAPLYANGKMVLSEIPSIFWLVAGMIISFSKPRSLSGSVLLGIFFGLFAAGKFQFAALLLVSLIVAHIFALKQKTLSWKNILITWFITIILVLPTVLISFNPAPGSEIETDTFVNIYASTCRMCDIGANLALFVSHSTLWYLVAISLVVIVAGIIYVRKRRSQIAWQVIFILIFALGDLAYFLLSPQVFRYLLPLQILLIFLLPWALDKILTTYSGGKYFSFLPYLLIGLVVIQIVHFATSADILRSDSVVKFERFVKDKISASESVGAINVSFAGVFLPSESYRQYLHFPRREEGRNFFRDNPETWPDTIIYGPYNFDTDIAPYLPRLRGLYFNVANFGNIHVWKRF